MPLPALADKIDHAVCDGAAGGLLKLRGFDSLLFEGLHDKRGFNQNCGHGGGAANGEIAAPYAKIRQAGASAKLFLHGFGERRALVVVKIRPAAAHAKRAGVIRQGVKMQAEKQVRVNEFRQRRAGVNVDPRVFLPR